MVAIVNGLVNPIPPIKGGGPQIVIWNTCREFKDTSFDWRVLSWCDAELDQYEYDREHFLQVKPTNPERMLVAFTRLLPYRLVKSIFGVYRQDHLLLNLAMVNNLKKINPNMIIIHESYSLAYMCHQRFPRKIILFYYHSCKMHEDLNKKQWERLVSSSTDGMISICAKAFDFTNVVFQTRPGNQWVIINGVNPSHMVEPGNEQKIRLRRDQGITPDDFIFLYVGRIYTRKGLDILLNSFAEILRQSQKPVRLMIIGSAGTDEDGSSEYEEQLITRAKAVSPDRITFHGFVPNEQLGDYYQMSDCGVLPTHLLEGNSLFLMECLSMGLPVIATKKGGVPEVVREGIDGILIEEEQLPTHFSKAMLSMIKEREIWNKRKLEIAASARERFDYKRVAQQLTGVIESVLRENE